MKKILFILIAAVTLNSTVHAQNYLTKNGTITFFSKTSMENIEAINSQVLSVLNAKNGELAFSVIVKGFLFKKALMQEHFNENYMESDTYPKSTFKGAITDISKVNFTKDGTYPVSVKGDLTIHGVTKNTTTPGTVTIKAGKVSAAADFIVTLADYKISIPKVVENNISPTIKISVACDYMPKN